MSTNLSRLLTKSTPLAVLLLLWPCLAATAQPGRGPVPVVVAPAVRQSVAAYQTFVGTVTPTKRATIGSAVDGRVVECPIEEGDRVEAGEMLAQLLTETISLELATAKAELDFKEAQLQELVNGTRPEVLEQARARMASAAARSEYASGRRDRLRQILNRSGAVTEDEWMEAVAAAIEAKELHAEAKAAYQEAEAGPRQELIAQAEAQVEMQRAVVARLEDQIAKHTIKTRFPGYVVSKHSEVGNWVKQGDPVAEIVAIDTVEVVAQVVEQSVPFIVPGSTVRVGIPALDREVEGRVLSAVPQGDLKARTFPVKIAVQNEVTSSGPLLKPGMYARVELPVGTEQDALLVPKDALVLSQRSPVVHVVEQSTKVGDAGKASPVPVTVGRAYGPLVQVTGPIEPGQLVVIEGNERLRPGQDVAISRIDDVTATTASAAIE